MKVKALHYIFSAIIAVSLTSCNNSEGEKATEEHHHGDGHDHEGEDLEHSKDDGHKHE
jgi:hypothetical protein